MYVNVWCIGQGDCIHVEGSVGLVMVVVWNRRTEEAQSAGTLRMNPVGPAMYYIALQRAMKRCVYNCISTGAITYHVHMHTCMCTHTHTHTHTQHTPHTHTTHTRTHMRTHTTHTHTPHTHRTHTHTRARTRAHTHTQVQVAI